MKNEHMKAMIKGAFLLSIASFIAKVLSAVYRVPFQNMVGNTGFYVYQQVYPLYGIGMTFALSGFPVFFSKTIAEAENKQEEKRLMEQSFVVLSCFAVVVFGFLYGFAPRIAQLMGDEQLTPIIRSVSWMSFFMPLLATLRGYFQGTYRMEPTAVSQVTEQLVRVGVILFFAYLYTKGTFDIYQMGAGAMSGALWGAGAAAFVLTIAFLKDRRLRKNKEDAELSVHRSSWISLIHRYATEGMTICLLTSILVLFQLVDSFTLYKGLVEKGILTETAKVLKGIYDRGQPLVQLGMVVGTGFSASFIPLMSRAYAFRREDEFNRAAKSLIRMTAIFSLAAVAGLLAILPEVNLMLFGDTSGSDVLAVYIGSIAAASIMMAYHSILQSWGQYRLSLFALALGLCVKWIANIIFIDWWGTMGASLATLLGLSVMVLFLESRMPLSLKGIWKREAFLIRLLLGCFFLFGSVYGIKWLLSHFLFTGGGRTAAAVLALLTVTSGVLIFGWYALRVQLLTIREWLSIPFGKKLLQKLPKK